MKGKDMSELKLLKYELDEHKHYRVIVKGLKFNSLRLAKVYFKKELRK